MIVDGVEYYVGDDPVPPHIRSPSDPRAAGSWRPAGGESTAGGAAERVESPDPTDPGRVEGRDEMTDEEALADAMRARDRVRGDRARYKADAAHFSLEDERVIGEASARAILRRYPLVATDSPVSIYVRKVGAILAEHSRRRDISYVFGVLESSELNAFAVPYGYIFITTGLLAELEDEAELAFVLSHEIVHVEKKHGLEQIVNGRLDHMKRDARARAEALAGRPFEGLDVQREMDSLSNLVVQGKGRPQEAESDRDGLRLMTRVGYDPRAAVNFLGRLVQLAGSRGARPAIFQSHDTPSERLVTAQGFVRGRRNGGERLAERYRDAVASLRAR